MKKTVLSATAALMTSAAHADIETRSFIFENEGAPLSGTLYLPEDHDGDALPTVLVTGAWTSVQQQMPATYAAEMVKRGFAAVTFDFRGWGQSGDLANGLRFVESPEAKISDIRAALKAISTLPEVDQGQIHGLGICASAGYMVDAASGNALVRKVGLVAPWLQNGEIVEAVYGGPGGVANLIEVARTARSNGGEVIPAAGPAGTENVLMPLDGYYVDPARGAIPEYDNKWNQISWEGWLSYAPADRGSLLAQPLAIVHSEAAAIPQGVRAFLEGYVGAPRLEWLEDVTQFDFYDNAEHVQQAADVMADHFSAQSVTDD